MKEVTLFGKSICYFLKTAAPTAERKPPSYQQTNTFEKFLLAERAFPFKIKDGCILETKCGFIVTDQNTIFNTCLSDVTRMLLIKLWIHISDYIYKYQN